MSHIKEPQPTGDNIAWTPIAWPVLRQVQLSDPAIDPQSRFADIMRLRRSDRQLSGTSLRRVIEVLAFATQPLSSWNSAGLPRRATPTAASGGLHGIELLITPSTRKPRLFHLAAGNRSLDYLDARRHAIIALEGRCNDCLPNAASATIIALVADRRKYVAAYQQPESLIWRDAGALLQSLSLTAAAFGLGSCILGIHGNEISQALPGLASRLQPCGVMKIGSSIDLSSIVQ